MVSRAPVRVVIADAHTRIRGRVRAALEADGCVVCGEGATADEAIALATEHRPEVALLDIHMADSGIRAAQVISATVPETAVVMLTQSSDDADLFDSLRAGARGYLLKGGDPGELGTAVRGVLAGEAAVDPRLVARILEEFRAPARKRFRRGTPEASRLSAREWEVMELLAGGASTEEAAGRLFLSPGTVRVHVSSAVRKLRVEDREAAFRLLRG